MAPAPTSTGVCPSESRNGRVSLTGCCVGSSKIIWFRISACRPACSRTPVASYITTKENTTHSANNELSQLSFSPTAVVRPTTSAVCDDGIPPLPTMRFQSSLPVLYQCVNTFANCAKLNASSALMSAGEDISAGTPVPRGAIATCGGGRSRRTAHRTSPAHDAVPVEFAGAVPVVVGGWWCERVLLGSVTVEGRGSEEGKRRVIESTDGAHRHSSSQYAAPKDGFAASNRLRVPGSAAAPPPAPDSCNESHATYQCVNTFANC
eukprot:CAMPEP_0119224052 /NCGR_PEP_ID=MMETSP1327-20130426/33474_1 /TAXON_ID=38833 /ORGANISM="Micromonas pusilla, Strain RCC2306" /LENGTH=263 /DNA_ID=CAMNT_0007222329 /DNA_START=229 /DNA_END=1018 /DNA_ORIENTATION=+